MRRLWRSALTAWVTLVLLGFPVASKAASPQPLQGFHLERGNSAHVQAAQAAGGQFVIKVFSWADIEPEPNYLYWEVPDATLRTAEFYGLQVVARLDLPPAWAATDSGPTPWRLDAYANFVRQVVERYGDRLAGVIIWNEPNLTLEWSNQPPDPTAYVEMLKAVYPVIKAVNPDLPVLLAGLAFTNDAGSNFNDLNYLQQIYEAGGAAYFDILAAHPYGFDRSPTDPPEPSQLNFRRLELHRRLMEANGDGHKPVWITDQGLFWRSPENDWQFVSGSLPAYAYVVTQTKDRFYAGFEGQGVWSAPQPDGPWQVNGLASHTVLDLAFDPNLEALYAATDAGIFVHSQPTSIWQRLPPLPGETENSLMRFTTRLYLGQDGQLVVRKVDRLWRWISAGRTAVEAGEWRSFGPPQFAETNKIYTVLDCCTPGAIVATRFLGLWQLAENEAWQRLDTDNTFGVTDATELLRVGDDLYAAGIIGLFRSADKGQTWQKVAGLPSTISDLSVDPTDPSRWIAATPAGVYRSQNRGQSWEAISPPWTVWDMAFDLNQRLFLARTSGIAWADNLGGESVSWQEADGLSQVLFSSVNPQPTNPAGVWAGTWGNDIGVSDDRGQTLASLGNGLETLGVLDILWHPTPGQVTVATIEGLYRTDDGGKGWFQLPGPLTRQTIYNLRQADDGIIWAAAADGLWASADYGATWTRAEGMPITTVIRLGSFSLSKGNTWLWAGTENDGLWLSQDGGSTWQPGGLDGRTIFNLFLDPLQPNRLVAATDVGIFETGFDDLLTNSKEAQ